MSFSQKAGQAIEHFQENNEFLNFGEVARDSYETLKTKWQETIDYYADNRISQNTLSLVEKLGKTLKEKTPKWIQKGAEFLEKTFGFMTKLKEKFMKQIEGIRSWAIGGIWALLGINLEGMVQKVKDVVWTTITEGVKKVEEKIEEKMDWLEEKIKFQERKEEFFVFLKKHNITAPDWLKNLSSAEVIKKLGLSPEDNSWQDYVGEAGFALLIYKFAGIKGLALNAGLYLGLVKRGPESVMWKELLKHTEKFDEWKKNFFETHPALEFLMPDFLNGANLNNYTDDFLKWIEENPAESMAAVNGLWFFRGILFSTLKLGLKSIGTAAMFGLRNLNWKGTLMALVATYGYLERKQIVDEIIDFTYWAEEGNSKNAMKVNLYDWFEIETSQKKYTETERSTTLEGLKKEENLKRQCIVDKMLTTIGFSENLKIKTNAYALLEIQDEVYNLEEIAPILDEFKLQESKTKQILIDTLLSSIFGEWLSPQKEEAQKKLYDWALIEEEKIDIKEAEWKIIIDELVGDPIKAFEKYWSEIGERFKKGDIGFGIVEDTGQLLLFLGKDLNVPLQLANLTVKQIDLLKFAFSDENQDGIIVPILTSTGLAYVFGKPSLRGFQAYGELIKSSEGIWKKILIATKWLIPGTKEYMYAVRSASWWLPGAESIYAFHKAEKIGESLEYLEEIKRKLGEPQLEKKEIVELCSKIKEKLRLLNVALDSETEKMSKHLLDTQYKKNLKGMYRQLDQISNLVESQTPDLVHARKVLDEVESGLSKYKSILASIYEKGPMGLVRSIANKTPSTTELEWKATKAIEKSSQAFEEMEKTRQAARQAQQEAIQLRQQTQGLTEAEAAKVTKQAIQAEEKAERLRKAADLSEEAVGKADEAAEAMRKAKILQETAEVGRNAPNSTQLAQEAQEAFQRAKQMARQAEKAEQAAEMVKLTTFGKILDRWGKVLGVAGAGFNIGSGSLDIVEGIQDQNQTRGQMQVVEGWSKIAIGGIEGATLVLSGAIGGLVVANTEIYKYMWQKGLASAKENVMTTNDWAKKETQVLIQELLATTDSLNAGDSYRAAFTKTTGEEIIKEKTDTRRKIVEALIVREGIKDPSILKNRMNYIAHTTYEFQFNTQEDLMKHINESRLYGNALAYADREKATGKTDVLLPLANGNNIDLLSPEIQNGPPDLRIVFAFEKLQQSEAALTIAPKHFSLFEKIGNENLVHILNQVGSYLVENENLPIEKKELLQKFQQDLMIYLSHIRNIYFEPEIIPNVTEKDIDKLLGLNQPTQQNLEKLEIEIHQIENNPISFALFEVAKMFGYTGKGTLADLKKFFSEEKKGQQGIYWNGKNWYINEAGLERDDIMDQKITYDQEEIHSKTEVQQANQKQNAPEKIIRRMIQRIRENSTDILETRNDAIVDITTTSSEEKMGQIALKIADKLEQGLEKYQVNNQ